MAIFIQSVSDDLSTSLFDTLVLNWVYASASDTLSLSDSFYANREGIQDTVNITEVLSYLGPHYVSLSDTLNLTDDLTTSGMSLTMIVSDILMLTDSALRQGNQISESVSDTLTLTDSGVRSLVPSDTLNIVDTVLWDVGKGLADKVNITEALVLNRVFAPISLSDSLSLVDGVGFYIQFAPTHVGCPITKTYSPFIYPNSSGYTPPSATEPSIVFRNTIILTLPYVSPNLVLELRNPLSNNAQKNTYKRIIRKTRGGTLKIFRDPIWPKFKALNYSIQMLKESDATELLNFFDQSLGLEVGLLDFESRQWRGYIITPSAQVSYEIAKVRSVQFEFEGALA